MKLAQAQIVTTALIPASVAGDTNVVPFCRRPWMSGSREVGNIRETIGATHAKVELLLEQTQDDRRERRDAEERIWIELRALKHDGNNSNQLVSARLELLDRRAGEIERRVGLIEKPVLRFVELRRSVVWLAGIIGGVIMLVVTLGRPVWDAVVQNYMSRK